HRYRHRPGTSREDLRGVPASRERPGAQGRGHRPGAHAHEEAGRAARRHDPCRERPGQGRGVHLQPSHPATMKPIVLPVEDNERNRKLARTVLEFAGYEVVECEDGEPALSLAKQHKPAIVLMDIELPKVDGITAFGQLRADPETASIPVIA